MEKTNIDHPLFELIRKEHFAVIKKLNLIDDLNTDMHELLEHTQWLWDYNESLHHKKEELLLFSQIYKNPRIKEGGPLCTLFFDSFLNLDPLKISTELTHQIPEIEAQQKIFYEIFSPLRIPIDEHRSGKNIIKYLLQNWKNLSRNKINSALTSYSQIQKKHIKKEEKCLFYMCCELLSNKEADNILLKWKENL